LLNGFVAARHKGNGLDLQERYNYNILHATDRNTILNDGMTTNLYEAHWTARIPIGQH
jgi:hypothetical protein